MDDLQWEVTVCNSMEPESSPLRQILSANQTYGKHLAAYLFDLIPADRCHKIMEIGGGYGFLMRDLLRSSAESLSDIRATMVDISPAMMSRQQKILNKFDICYIKSDFFDIDPEVIKTHDLLILNEIVGDFPTACNITHDALSNDNQDDPFMDRIQAYIRKGIIELPEEEPFNLNIGAMMALERACSYQVPYIFLSEHSCEAAVTDYMAPYIRLKSKGNPEEIRLIGHSEYTIRFSDLVNMARSFGYTVIRGNYTDFITVNFTNRIHRIFKSNSQTDNDEIIRHFIEDLYIYEYLFLIRESQPYNQL